jgi:hypothetical protein
MTHDRERPDPSSEARARLPREIHPQRDLWPAIRREITREQPSPGAGTVGLRERITRYLRTPSWALVGATAALACILGALGAWNLRSAQRPEVTGTSASPAAITETLDALEHECARMQADLLAILSNPEYDANPETKDILLANLAIIESAVAESRAALREHPNDTHLAELTLSAYRERLSFLKDATRVPVGTPERGQI